MKCSLEFRPVSVATLFGALLVLIPVASAANAGKVDLCHRTGNGSFHSISVNANALDAHLAHGDVLQPNGAVPGGQGFVFDRIANAVQSLGVTKSTRPRMSPPPIQRALEIYTLARGYR